MWVVYFNPTDFPGLYVVRKFIGEEGSGFHMVRTTLEAAREPLKALGLTCIQRMEGDEPQIVEVWL